MNPNRIALLGLFLLNCCLLPGAWAQRTDSLLNAAEPQLSEDAKAYIDALSQTACSCHLLYEGTVGELHSQIWKIYAMQEIGQTPSKEDMDALHAKLEAAAPYVQCMKTRRYLGDRHRELAEAFRQDMLRLFGSRLYNVEIELLRVRLVSRKIGRSCGKTEALYFNTVFTYLAQQ